ncbi:MAG: TolC family protein, partial [Myxococcota bacterium]
MTLRTVPLLALIVGWTAWSIPGFAEELETPGSDEIPELAEERETPGSDEPPMAEPAPAPSMEHPSLHGDLKLTLADAIRMGLENNLDVQVERFAPLIAGEEEEIAWGSYDPEFFGDVDYSDGERPTGFLTGSNKNLEEKSIGGGTGLRGSIPLLGSSYNLEFTSSRDETDLVVQSISPAYNSSINLSLSQPLLRNLIWSRPWTRVKTSRVLYEASEEQFRTEVMDTVQLIADGYWDLVASRDQVRVADKSLETAEALLDQTKTQYEVGVVSRVEVVEAEAGAAAREFDLIVAENRYRNSQDQLIDLVLGPHLSAGSTMSIDPGDSPDDFVEYEIDPQVAMQRAFAHRPELIVADKAIERDTLELKFAKNQRLPQMDATFSYGNLGLAGTSRPDASPPAAPNTCGLTPCPPPTGYRDAFDGWLTGSAAAQLTAGVMVSIPILNSSARHRATQADLELRRSITQRRRLEQTIILEVRRAVRNLLSSQEGIQAAERRTAAASEQLRAEKIRLEYGESTPFDVLLRESDFVEAESQQIVAFQ